MVATPRLGLALLSAGQAQKELFHNEALHKLDMLVAAAVAEPPRASPPTSPVAGDCYILAGDPTGAWQGHPYCVASYTSGGWRFVEPVEGMAIYVRSEDGWAIFRGGSWEIGRLSGASLVVEGKQVVGARMPAIESPAGGTIVDGEARQAIELILAT